MNDKILVPEFEFGTHSPFSKEKILLVDAFQLLISASCNDIAIGLFNFFKKRDINLIKEMKIYAV